ncbi:MAG TPA: protein kinase [Pyrinomonadaceae bacterium]|nr:protein kinase [Pyrinomonadaceae bacterium]
MQPVTISNRYRILQNLGEGGFGQTFLAEDLHLPTKPRCVVKRLKPPAGDEETVRLARRLFEQEAEVLYRLGSHTQIPTILAHFEEAGEFYLVQELIEGETLAQEFAGGKKYTEPQAIDLMRQILETLAFVHEQNVIHRDIKPSNLIRRASDGKIFLIDFGAVKQVSVNPFNNRASFHSTVAIGSAGYTPGEQAAGKPCFASDLYAAGLVTIEALTQLHPLKLSQNRTTGEFLWQHKASLQPDLMSFVNKLVRYDFRQRFHSAKEAFAALNTIAASLGYGRKLQNYVPAKVLQPLRTVAAQTPLVVQNPGVQNPVAVLPQTPPLTPEQFPPTVAPTQPAPPPQNLPPTIVYSPQPVYQPEFQKQNGYQRIAEFAPARQENKGFFQWIWNNDLALGVVVAALVLGFFIIGGYVLISSAVKSADVEARKNAIANNTAVATQMPSPGDSGVYREALAQADDAAKIERKATTRFEWEEIGNKYKRASTLLASVHESSPDYADAQSKIADYKLRSDNAFLKAGEIRNNPQLLTANTNPQSTTTQYSTSPSTVSTNYPSAATASTPAPRPLKIARQPSPRREKSFLVFSSSEGDYIGKGLDWVFTSDESRFTASGGSKRYLNLGADGNGKWFYLTLSVPDNLVFQPGTYPNAGYKSGGNSNAYPSLSFSGDGRGCTVGDAGFTIHNIQYNEMSNELLYLDVSFRQRCQNTSALLLGRFRYDIR